jgi:Tetratrico peptide repeat
MVEYRPAPVGEPTGAMVDWERRLAAAWASLDRLSEAEFLASIEQLAAELPTGSAIGLFERAAAFDSTGHPDLAVPLYRQALDRGLPGERRRRAVIQLASSLRNLGQAQESVGPAQVRAARHVRPLGRRRPGLPSDGPGRPRPGAGGGLARPCRPGTAPPPLPALAGQLRQAAPNWRRETHTLTWRFPLTTDLHFRWSARRKLSAALGAGDRSSRLSWHSAESHPNCGGPRPSAWLSPGQARAVSAPARYGSRSSGW